MERNINENGGVYHSYSHPELIKKHLERESAVKNDVKSALKPLRTCLVVNLFGGPSAGKSTLSSGVFYNLKRRGYNCALIREYTQDKVYEESFNVLQDQLYILGKQQHKQFIARDKVDVLITEAPILLSLYYARNYSDAFKTVVKETFNEYDNLNYLVERAKNKKYNPAGRTQDEGEAYQVHKSIAQIIKDEGVTYKIVQATSIDQDDLDNMHEDEAVSQIVRDVIMQLKEKKKSGLTA